MKHVKHIRALGLLGCALLASHMAQAQTARTNPAWTNTDWANSAWYIGAGGGRTETSIDQDEITRSLTAGGATSVLFSSDERDTAYRVFVGKQLNRIFAIEAGYVDLGNFSFNATTILAGTLNGEVDFRGGYLDLLAQLPLSQRFSIYGRLGMHYTEAEASFTGNRLFAVTNRNPSRSKLNAKAGLGVEFRFTEALSLRGEAERYRVDDAVGNRGDVDFYSLNLVYKLGKPAPPPPVAFVPPPAPPPVVVPAPPPPPPPAPPPRPVPVSEKVTFSARTLFDFDRSDLKPEGMAALDDLVSRLQGMNTEVMVAVGHTDSVGTDSYNQSLSIRRAEAVKTYLVSKNIDANRIYTEGKGEKDPVADNSTAEGRQQNRRVTVEVVGTRTTTR